MTPLLGLLACGPARIGEPFGPPVPLAGQAEPGEVVFMRHCHSCHPGGSAGLGPGILDKPLPPAAIRLQIRAGIGAMPSFPDDRLSDPEMEAIVAYLTALRRAR